MIPPEILTAAEMRCDVAGIWALAIAADPTGRQARREILTAALEEAAPMLAAFPRCPTLCDADCEQACHEVHAPPQQQEHNPETCLATIVAAAAAAERAKLARELKERADELDGMVPPDGVSETDQSLYTGGMRRAAHLIEHGDVPAAADPTGETP